MKRNKGKNEIPRSLVRQIVSAHFTGNISLHRITNLKALAKDYGFEFEELQSSALKCIDYLEELRYSNLAHEIEQLENLSPSYATYDFPIEIETKPTTQAFPT